MFKPICKNIQLAQESHELLLKYLLTINKEALILKYIGKGNAYFESTMKYPVKDGDFAKYLVTATVPLSSPMFCGDDIFYVYPSKVQDSIIFTLTGFVDKNGYGIRK